MLFYQAMARSTIISIFIFSSSSFFLKSTAYKWWTIHAGQMARDVKTFGKYGNETNPFSAIIKKLFYSSFQAIQLVRFESNQSTDLKANILAGMCFYDQDFFFFFKLGH